MKGVSATENLLSVVVPAYNEELNVENTVNELARHLDGHKIPFEMIVVDDGSKDNTWGILEELVKSKTNMAAVKFSRNFGKEAAIFAGLRVSKGACCAVMDCDLQHPPETLVLMYELWKNNHVDVVEARKKKRSKESWLYRIFAAMFYKIIKSTSQLDLDSASDFKLMDRKVVDTLNSLPERITFFRALSSWVGYNTEIVYFETAPRAAGETKWSFSKLFKYALSSISSFSNFPMQVVTVCGLIFFVFAVVMTVNTMFNLISGRSAEGFTTVILLLLIIGSITMFSLGIIGHYLSKIYEEVKFRPRYIIEKTIESQNG